MSLRDKLDATKGLVSREGKQISTYQHTVSVDTRDCVGINSLSEAKATFISQGGRGEASGLITKTTGIGLPIKITTTTSTLKNGDFVIITGVQGNTICNNEWKISNVTPISFDIGGIGNGNYAGGGMWLRQADNGFPRITTTTSTIIGNEITIMLQKKLKAIKSITLNLSIIPRDIIPISCYYKDLYTASTSPVVNVGESYIPQEVKFMTDNSYGFYSTPLSIFRTYDGIFSIPNQVTPPPLNLWNPLIGPWPLQPLPYPFQTVPTYRSDNILIGTNNYHIICSGYGVYDFNDWTGSTRASTEIARKALLMIIVRPQMYNGIDYVELINNCNTTSNNISPYGYGNFQRFICGPGLQLNYQPGTTDSADPTVAAPDWPIAFPSFRGNIWGPYDSPGDRFQKMGLKDTLQDLFLNGDLDNLFGVPIINSNIITSEIINDSKFGINQTGFITVNFSNYISSTNPNILNAMRIVPNGFGAASVIAKGSGNPLYTNAYANSGGIGPSNLGMPSAWSTSGIYGVPNFDDPSPVGNLSANLLTNGTIPQTSVSNLPPNNSNITHRIASFDLGAHQGSFKSQMKSYYLYASFNLPSTNLVIQVFQFPRTERSQSTNSLVGPSIFNVPIRIFPGVSMDGGFDYLEGLYALITQSSEFEYWGERFLTPMASLDKISLRFTTYEGTPIPLEKILSYSPNALDNVSGTTNSLINSRRFISLLFRVECYTYVLPGLVLDEIIDKILGANDDTEKYDFSVKASNYEDYT